MSTRHPRTLSPTSPSSWPPFLELSKWTDTGMRFYLFVHWVKKEQIPGWGSIYLCTEWRENRYRDEVLFICALSEERTDTGMRFCLSGHWVKKEQIPGRGSVYLGTEWRKNRYRDEVLFIWALSEERTDTGPDKVQRLYRFNCGCLMTSTALQTARKGLCSLQRAVSK